jgi:hypothetical protein
MVVNESTASRTAFLRRTVVCQLTVDKLNKELPRWKGERLWRGKATAPAAAQPPEMAIGLAAALRNLQPRFFLNACRVSQARCPFENDDASRVCSLARHASLKFSYGYR